MNYLFSVSLLDLRASSLLAVAAHFPRTQEESFVLVKGKEKWTKAGMLTHTDDDIGKWIKTTFQEAQGCQRKHSDFELILCFGLVLIVHILSIVCNLCFHLISSRTSHSI